MNNEKTIAKRDIKLWLQSSLSRSVVKAEDLVKLTQDEFNEIYHEVNESIIKHNKLRSEANHRNADVRKKFKDEIFPMAKSRLTVYKNNGSLYAHWQKVLDNCLEFVPPHKSELVSLDRNTTVNISYDKGTTSNYLMLGNIIEHATNLIKVAVRKMEKANDMFSAAVTYVQKHDLNTVNCLLPQDYIDLCNEHAKDVYFNEMEGEVIDVTHGDGDDCEWEIGAHRCECGNNRYYLEIDGNFVDGFDSYGQYC